MIKYKQYKLGLDKTSYFAENDQGEDKKTKYWEQGWTNTKDKVVVVEIP